MTEFGNHPPVLDPIGPQFVAERETLTFGIRASDLDADPVVLDTVNVPLNAVFVDSGNGAGSFSFAPDTGQAGIYPVTFIVSDGLVEDSELVQITVTEWANRPPALDSIGPKSVAEGESLTVAISAYDPDGAVPLLLCSNIPDNATFVDSGNGHGSFRFYPDFYQAGTETVSFEAVDTSYQDELSDIENVLITILEVNRPPVVDSIGPKTVKAGDTLKIRVVGRDSTDWDGGPLHMTALGLPTNSTFNDSGGGIAGFKFTPDYTQVGVDTVTFRCTDEGSPAMTGSRKVQITVTEGANRPPVLDAIGYKMVTEGQILNFRVHASDPDGTTPLLYTSMPLPPNASFVDSANGAGSFHFAPGYSQSGIYQITFYASDGDLVDYEQVLIQVVEAGNQRPVLDSIGAQSVTEGDSLIFMVSAADPESSALTLSAQDLPFGASFADSSNGTGWLRFRPEYVQSGVYHPIFIASDGSLADSETVELTVIEAGNQPPHLVDSIGAQSVVELQWLTFSVSAADPDSSTPLLRASGLPPAATFVDNGDGTGSFSYHATFEDQGVYYSLFEAVDSVDTLLRSGELVEITVIDVNRAPTVRFEPDSGTYHYYEGKTRILKLIGTDPDGPPPSVHITPLPANATLVDSGNGVGVFTWTPGYNQGSVPYAFYTVTPWVVDADYPDTNLGGSRNIFVYDLPEPPNVLPINDTTVMEGASLNIRVITTSIADIPVLTAGGLPRNSTFTDSTNGRGLFRFNPDYTQGDSAYDVRFMATSRGLADTEWVHVAVVEFGNHTPVLDSIGAKTINEMQTLKIRLRATDADTDPITLQAANVPTNAAFVDSGGGIGSLVFSPDWTQAETYFVTFRAVDSHAAVDSEVVQITVVNVDQSPVLDSIGPKTVDEGQTLQFRVHGTDVDSDSLVLTAAPLPMHATFHDSGNGAGVLTFTPDYYQAGNKSIYFTVSDLVNSDYEQVVVTIVNVPQPPSLDSIGPRSVVEGSVLTFRIHATDPDGDQMTFSVANNPPNSSLIDSGNGAGSFAFSPSFVQAGHYPVTFKVTDATGKPDSELVDLNVTEAGNQPPVLYPLPDTTEPVVGDSFRLHVRATDPDGPSIILTVSGLPNHAAFFDSGGGGGLFTFAPDSTQADSVYPVTFTASDGSLSDDEMVAMKVISFVPGDASGDGVVSLGDVVFILNYLFRNGPAPVPTMAGDLNCSGDVELGDAIYLLNYLFRSGPPPPGSCP